MAKLTFLFTLISFLPFLCNSFSTDNPTDRKILVLVDNLAIKSSHSILFKSLQTRGLELVFKLVDDPKMMRESEAKTPISANSSASDFIWDIATECEVDFDEDDPSTNTGRGSSLTDNGHVECDASIMDGDSGAFGAVGAVLDQVYEMPSKLLLA